MDSQTGRAATTIIIAQDAVLEATLRLHKTQYKPRISSKQILDEFP
jgi:hypothetical protein